MTTNTLSKNSSIGKHARHIASQIARQGGFDAETVRSEMTDVALDHDVTYGVVSHHVYGILAGNPDASRKLTAEFRDKLLPTQTPTE